MQIIKVLKNLFKSFFKKKIREPINFESIADLLDHWEDHFHKEPISILEFIEELETPYEINDFVKAELASIFDIEAFHDIGTILLRGNRRSGKTTIAFISLHYIIYIAGLLRFPLKFLGDFSNLSIFLGNSAHYEVLLDTFLQFKSGHIVSYGLNKVHKICEFALPNGLIINIATLNKPEQLYGSFFVAGYISDKAMLSYILKRYLPIFNRYNYLTKYFFEGII